MAGTLTVTSAERGALVYTLAWTSTSGGAVSGNTFSLAVGKLVQVRFVPSATAAPTTLYDVTLVDAAAVDVLSGAGANLSATAGSYLIADPPIVVSEQGPWDLVVANAGNAKSGTVTLWIERFEAD